MALTLLYFHHSGTLLLNDQIICTKCMYFITQLFDHLCLGVLEVATDYSKHTQILMFSFIECEVGLLRQTIAPPFPGELESVADLGVGGSAIKIQPMALRIKICQSFCQQILGE
jgi:hypothetical protein